jgi:hypothetical protein
VVGGLERGEWELDSCVSCSILGRTEAIQTWETKGGKEIERKENWRDRWGDAEMQREIGRKKGEEKKRRKEERKKEMGTEESKAL